MYLDETGLSREKNTTTSTLRELNTLQGYRLFMESLNNKQVMLDDHWQEKIYEVSVVLMINFDGYCRK